MKRLTRSSKNKMVAGVCSGLANYLNIDPTFIRLIWAIAIFALGIGVLPYIICAFIIPLDVDVKDYNDYYNNDDRWCD